MYKVNLGKDARGRARRNKELGLGKTQRTDEGGEPTTGHRTEEKDTAKKTERVYRMDVHRDRDKHTAYEQKKAKVRQQGRGA